MVITKEYTDDSIITYNESGSVVDTKSVTENVIKVNFNLGERTPSSTDYTHIIVKANGDKDCDSLQSSEEIEFVEKAEVTFPADNNIPVQMNCYWFRNNAGNVLFAADETEITLQDGEYFIYTDNTFSSLEILGGGTKLTRSGYTNEWSISDTTLSKSELLNGDQGTLKTDVNWQYKVFDSTHTLTFTEQVFLTLTDGDIVSTSLTVLNGTPTPLSGEDFYYNGKELEDGDNWKVYTILALNAGPSNPQKIQSEAGYIDESIKIITTTNTSGTPYSDGYLFLNEPLHIATTNPIDLSQYVLLNDEGEDILQFNGCVVDTIEEPSYTKGGVVQPLSANAQGFRFIEWNDIPVVSSNRTVTINVPFVDDEITRFSVYAKGTDTVTIQAYNGSSTVGSAVTITGLTNLEYSSTITKIVINNSTTSSSTTAELIISPLKITTGINQDLGVASDDTTITTEIAALLDGEVWYDTLKINNEDAINNVPLNTATALWDKNNIANRFTIAKIDFEESEFSIVKSSQI